MGKLVTVEITSASKFSMTSRVVTEGSAANPAPVKKLELKRVRSLNLPLPLLTACVAAVAYFVLRFLSMWQ